MTVDPIDFPTAVDISTRAFEAENRVLQSLQVVMHERLPDGTVHIREAAWNADTATPTEETR